MLGFDGIRRSVAERRIEMGGVVVGKPAIEGSEEGAGAGPLGSQTNSSFRVRRKRSVSALPLGCCSW
jgi:hypothetical protein